MEGTCMKNSRENRIHLLRDRPRLSDGLWCGKVQDICDGSICPSCHLFPEKMSILATPSLTDLEDEE